MERRQKMIEKVQKKSGKKTRRLKKTLEEWREDSRGFNGSVNISESCDFRSQFDPLYITL